MVKKIIDGIALSFKNWKTEWGNLFLLLIPIGLAIPKFNKLIVGKWYWLLLTIIIFCVCWIQSNYSKEKMSSLKLSNSKLNSQLDSIKNTVESLNNTIEATPEMIIKYINFSLELTYQDRISIYRYNIANELFIPIGRYSKNPVYTKKGRDTYSKDNGYISKAWMNGTFYVDKIPSFERTPKRYLDYVTKQTGMERSILENISMKSRCYFCKNLTHNDRAIAVIVIETTNEKLNHDELHLSEFLEGPFGQLLVESIENNLPLGEG
ncbi:hypothetical protein [Rummeliibacillus sp. BSL5]